MARTAPKTMYGQAVPTDEDIAGLGTFCPPVSAPGASPAALRFITRRAFRYAGEQIAKGVAVTITDPREARRLVNTGFLMNPMEVMQ